MSEDGVGRRTSSTVLALADAGLAVVAALLGDFQTATLLLGWAALFAISLFLPD